MQVYASQHSSNQCKKKSMILPLTLTAPLPFAGPPAAGFFPTVFGAFLPTGPATAAGVILRVWEDGPTAVRCWDMMGRCDFLLCHDFICFPLNCFSPEPNGPWNVFEHKICGMFEQYCYITP